MEEAGWLCEPEDAINESWLSDIYWAKASGRRSHTQTCRHKGGLLQMLDHLADVSHSNFRDQVFYGNPALSRGEMVGFYPRFDTRDPSEAQCAVNVLDGGEKGDNLASIWIVGWGRRTVYVATNDGQPIVGIGEAALIIADWRFVMRIANVGVMTDLKTQIEIAMMRMPTYRRDDAVRPAIYMPPHLCERLGASRFRSWPVRDVLAPIPEQRI